jgi:hypothetical protein
MTSASQLWARVPPALAWKHPGLPREWTRVLERNPEAMQPEPLPGYVWLDARPPPARLGGPLGVPGRAAVTKAEAQGVLAARGEG